MVRDETRLCARPSQYVKTKRANVSFLFVYISVCRKDLHVAVYTFYEHVPVVVRMLRTMRFAEDKIYVND